MTETQGQQHTISSAVHEFIHDLTGVKSAEQIACPLIQSIAIASREKFTSFAKTFQTEPDDKVDAVTYLVPFEASKEFRQLQRKMQSIQGAIYQAPRALLVAMVSAFDAYLGRLLRCIFVLKPELIDSSERVLTFSDLVKLNSVDAARDYMIDSEIESFLRKSHIEHFEQLEKRLGIELRRGLNSWPIFVELTQRRNLFVHCDGIISQQYLDVCSKVAVHFRAEHRPDV